MNHLAHFHLSYGDEQLLLGALLGDHVKGPLKGEWSSGLERGIQLHRHIDAFTDSHQDIRHLQKQLDPRFRRYSGIMLDVLFDHYLTRHWSQFHPQPLPLFSRQVYQVLDNHTLPVSSAQQQAERLAYYDVLTSYEHWSTVEAALQRISQRLRRENPLAEGAAELLQHYAELEAGFLRFYPELVQYCSAIRRDWRNAR